MRPDDLAGRPVQPRKHPCSAATVGRDQHQRPIHSGRRTEPLVQLVVVDLRLPDLLAFQIESLTRHVEQLPRTSQRPFWSVEERTILDLMTKIRLTDGVALVPGVLEPFLASLAEVLDTFSQALHQAYLAKIDPMEALQARGKDPE